MPPTPIFLDTDIGDDVDDLLALAIACVSPELELAGVGTVFGPTRRRTRVARSALLFAGKEAPVYVGLGAPMTPADRRPEFAERIARRFDPAEGIALHVDCGLPEAELPAVAEESAPAALRAFWKRWDASGRTVAIGPLTNLGAALRGSEMRPPLTVMAGEFEGRDWAEWNVLCDPEAAAIVFGSGCLVDVIPFQIGVDLSFTDDETRRFTSLGTPLSDLIREAIELWKGQGFGFHVWDLLAVLAAGRPELFEWKSGQVRVETGANLHGFTSFEPAPGGLHRIAVDADRDIVANLLLDRLVTSCRRELRDR